ncbi:MAG TPA: coenzyme F420-0:L-glutamate ligase [Terriglobia bacterium]|jgi:coenzyme F420-0:L-glutamate ligase/coenzyme F420-1:gamma-L-glutamate ligase|nr:coenzyme F420-0:L-glutamate ligase [Terriglobia bacterium]
MKEVRAIPVDGIGEIRAGDDLADLILAALKRQRLRLVEGDILVVTHKIVSKAEGRVVALASVRPSATIKRWARRHGRDPRVLALALRESRRVVRKKNGVLITETLRGTRGFVCAQSGVDVSNIDGGSSAALLPRAPDASAARLHRVILKRTGNYVPVIITDSFGRPWREGLTEVAIGCAGMAVLRDARGRRDSYGYRLQVTLEAVADELAGMAGMVCGKLSRIPACVIRGFAYRRARGRAGDLVRDAARDLFR